MTEKEKADQVTPKEAEPKANADWSAELMQSSGAKPLGGLCAVLP